MSTSEIPSVDFDSAQRDYWHQVRQSEGFDIENVSVPSNMCGMITGLLPIDCVRERGYPYPVLVNLYAKMGLHRYNMLKGTNFQLDSLVKFNMLQNCVSSVYMTLLAHEPAPDPLAKTFQVRVDEHKANSLAFECSIARIKDEVITKKPFVPHFHGDALAYGIFKGELPNWPSDDALNDGKRFYLLKESEWQANDWISMYLELVICAHDRRIRKRDVYSQLEILEVAIETGVEDVEPPIETGVEDVEPPNERLNATSVNVYIKFKGMENVITPMMIFESGEHVEHKAVVRRVLNEHSGDMTLSGKFCGGLSTKKKIQSSKKRTRSD